MPNRSQLSSLDILVLIELIHEHDTDPVFLARSALHCHVPHIMLEHIQHTLHGYDVNNALAVVDKLFITHRIVPEESCSSAPEACVEIHECCDEGDLLLVCLLYTSPSPRDRTRSRMPSSA
eukprot:TRINITY_DN16368_c0_g1_i3.p1 TRINITY_DN16368_c0_g1~~TRINITY_DN16368_c0_g1_i3.p1  ORF type:complete len:121 (-),score=7.14 TRINITY_DN16368_c0_g1_i3:39-401(-)